MQQADPFDVSDDKLLIAPEGIEIQMYFIELAKKYGLLIAPEGIEIVIF